MATGDVDVPATTAIGKAGLQVRPAANALARALATTPNGVSGAVAASGLAGLE